MVPLKLKLMCQVTEETKDLTENMPKYILLLFGGMYNKGRAFSIKQMHIRSNIYPEEIFFTQV